MDAITLFELNGRVKQALKLAFPQTVWITAEITEIQVNNSGHCYLQLADKKEQDDSIIATARATIWAFVFRTLKPYFETTTGRALAKGMKVMLNVEIVFHELYGYSLNVRDIDPAYTMGDIERKRREILLRLEQEGVIDMNRELEFPILPKNIAVISSPTAAGYGDFMDQMINNPYGYRFHIKLFPAIMQGERTTESVIDALDRIYGCELQFDVVVIIRGGGSQTDLGCFDSYDMAANVAQFPFPVIAGIGHERDETIIDRVAHTRVKTPTAAAAVLIEAFNAQAAQLDIWKNDFLTGVQELLHREKNRQLLAVSAFKHNTQALLAGNKNRLQLLSQQIGLSSGAFIKSKFSYFENITAKLDSRITLLFERQKDKLRNYSGQIRQKTVKKIDINRNKLEIAATTIKYIDPHNVLERGYSITRINGKAVKDADLAKTGDILETELSKGTIRSIVEK